MGEVKAMATCKVCGRDFPLIAEEHYVAKDVKGIGITEILSSKEPELFDAFDCPHCGCQNVMQTRKRVLFDECEFDDVEHDGCKDCKFDDVPLGGEPCKDCTQSYQDLYERRK